MRSINTAILASASLLALAATPAFAQAVPAAPEDQTPEKQQESEQIPPTSLPTTAQGQTQKSEQQIVVTGSRIRRDNFSTPQNIDVITRDDAILGGTRSTAETLQQATVTSGTAQINGAFLGFVSEGGAAANTVGLRGLGSTRTLVLLNGRRLAPAGVGNQLVAADLNVLPTAVVQRIEVLREGASSIYGSDAIAGVINIITDTSINGLTLDGFADAPLQGGGETLRGSATWGKTFSRGHILISGEYREFEGLRQNQRSNYRCPRDLFKVNGQEVGQIDPSTGKLRCFPFAFDGLGIASGYGVFVNFNTGAVGRASFPGYTTGNPVIGPPVIVNNLNLRPSPSPMQELQDVISPVKTYTGYANASYDLDALGNAELYGEALFTRRTSKQHYAYQLNTQGGVNSNAQLYGGSYYGTPLEDYGYPVSPFEPVAWANAGVNYFSPFIVPDKLSFDKQEVNFFRANGGVRGDLPFGDWRYDANVQVSRTRSKEDVWNPTVTALSNALEAVPAPAGTPAELITVGLPGQTGAGISYTCGSNVTNGAYNGGKCAPLNFYDPQILLYGHIPDAAYNYIWQDNIDRTHFDQDTFSLGFDGSLFPLPGGMVKAAVGYEHRHDHIRDVPSEAALSGELYNRASAGITEGSDTVDEGYGEVDAPILRDRPFFNLLEVDGSVRYTHYKSYGSDWTYHVNAQWAPAAVIKFRGNYGTNFRAPNLYEQFVADQTGFYPASYDPCSSFGTQVASGTALYNNCLAALSPILGQAGALTYLATAGPKVTTSGGAGNLKAEHATTWGFGGVVTVPRHIADLSLAVDYWNIKVRDEVSILGNTILNLCYEADDFPNNRYCDLIGPREVGGAHPGALTTLLNPYLNVSRQDASGIDFDARFATRLFGGQFQTQLQATRNLHQKLEVFAGSGTFDYNGTPGYPGFGAGPKWVGNLDTRFRTHNNITLRWGVRYIGKQTAAPLLQEGIDLINGQLPLPGIGLPPGTTGDYDIVAEAYWEHSASVQWEWPNLGQITVGVHNVFNRKPPTIGGFPTIDGQTFRIGNTFGAGSYDYLGRSVFVNVTRKF